MTYRHPGLLAKTVTTLDVLSGGRAVFGIGAAWYEREHRALGVPFPPLRERFERLEETIQICLADVGPGGQRPLRGQALPARGDAVLPAAAPPRPRILIGGGGEQKTLRLVAQYADACNLFGDPPTRRAQARRPAPHCDDVGRDVADIRVTITANNPRPEPGDTDAFVAAMADYAKFGVHQVMVTPTTGSPAAWIEGMTPAIAQLADLG